ncbi:MAG TPA: DUF302 domain-containing protein [Lamprocystis sp. (in: g-proteobacteria)]|nr:DUF302 domain-containing protein [Lamprocystis sp. (in: g-proteobacteria)]
MIKNALAAIGLAAVVGMAVVALVFGSRLAAFDPGAPGIYWAFAQRVLASGDPGVAMMWSVPVKDGLSTEDVIESMKSLATSRNLLFVGESPFYKQIEAITGQGYRYVNFLSFCDAQVGRQMLEYRDQYSGFMPCRIALVEDKQGKLWLYSMNLDLMIYGGAQLPDDLKAAALRVRDSIRYIMDGAAVGEF